MTDFYNPLLKLRDYFIRTDELAGAEVCNTMLQALDDAPKVLVITEEEARIILKFFYEEAGYISYETEKLDLRNVIRKLEDHFYGPRKFQPTIQGKIKL